MIQDKKQPRDGGSWFAVGARVIREVEKQNPGLVTQVQTGGGLTNLRKVQAGQADIGMTFAFAARPPPGVGATVFLARRGADAGGRAGAEHPPSKD